MLQLTGHTDAVHALAFSPDAKTLFSAGKDCSIRIWNVARGCEKARLEGHAGAVLCLAVHKGGSILASGGADAALKLWRLPDGKPIESYPKQMAAVTGVAWIPERAGSLMTACGERLQPDRGGELRLWDLADGAKPRNLHVGENGYWSLAVAEHKPTVAWGGGARRVEAWDVTHQQPRTFRLSSPSLVVALSPDGALLASAVERNVKVWDVGKGHERATLEAHKGMVRALAFAPCGRVLATGGQDQTVRFWSLRDGAITPGPEYHWPVGGVHSLAFSPDGMLAAAGGDSGAIWLWDLDD